MVGGAEAIRRSPTRRTIVWSSLTRTNPRSSRRSARSDLPEPEGPEIITARPSSATVLAWSVSDDRRALFPFGAVGIAALMTGRPLEGRW